MLAPLARQVARQLQDCGFRRVVRGTDETLVSLAETGRDEAVERRGGGGRRTRLAMVPLMLAMRTMLPPFPNLTICFATAWAVMNTPVTLTLIMRSTSLAVYSKAGVSCWIPAAAIRPSMRPSFRAISSIIEFRESTSRTSMRRYESDVPSSCRARWAMRSKSGEGVSSRSRA